MKDKTILITGATDGIGLQAALDLAKMGPRMLLHGRDEIRGQVALDAVRRVSSRKDHAYLNADLSSLANVRELNKIVREATNRLDVLINNAGLIEPHFHLTIDGFETTFAVNHLSQFLLTNLLLDLLKSCAPSRIVVVASTYHHVGPLDFDNLNAEKGYSPLGAYALSKLCNILFTRELSRRLEGTDVTVNCLHPGGINTKLLRDGFGHSGASVKQGARTPVYLASSFEVDGISGEYFMNMNIARPSNLAQDDDLAKKLWDLSAKMVGL